jgi:hypothetical protein
MGRYYGPTDMLLAQVLALLGDLEMDYKVGPDLYRQILGTLTEVIIRQQREIAALKSGEEGGDADDGG